MQIKSYTTWSTLVLAAAIPAGAQAITGIPEGGNLEFTVLRYGDEAGTHTIRFRRGDADEVTVDVATDADVKLPVIGVSVYHFEHQGHGVWRDSALLALESSTDDDGDARALEVVRDGETLAIEGTAAAHRSAGRLIPASLWHPGLVRSRTLLDTLDRHQMAVAVTDAGEEPVAVHGKPVAARRYVVSGGLERELWYDPRGVLVKVAFAAKDGSQIEYVLQ